MTSAPPAAAAAARHRGAAGCFGYHRDKGVTLRHGHSILTGCLMALAAATTIMCVVRAAAPPPRSTSAPIARRIADRFLYEAGLTTPRGGPDGNESILVDISSGSGLDFAHENDASDRFRLPELLGPGAGLLDYDADGDLDVFVGGGGGIGDPDREQGSRLFRNDGGTFADVSAAARADIAGPVYGVACADIDNDGDEDIYVTRLGPNRLLRNRGDGSFEETGETAGVDDDGYGTSAAFLDYDRDGRLDLYVANYVDWNESKETPCYSILGERDYCSPSVYESAPRHVLYHNLGDGRFENVTESAGIDAETGQGLGVLASDFDDDGWTDIFVACDQTPGILWRNIDGHTFENVAYQAGCAFDTRGVAIAGMGVACEDLDGDLDLDLIVTNIRDQMHLVLRNDGGVFSDVSTRMGMGVWSIPATGFGIALFDQDHDGGMDAFVANGHVVLGSHQVATGNPYAQPDQFLRLRDGKFRDHSSETRLGPNAVSRALAKGDLDGDGDIDLIISVNGDAPRLILNQSDPANHWIMVDARLIDERRRAIGARVTVEAGGSKQVREIRPQESYLSSGDPRAHFGLGAAQIVDRITVRWPDGTETVREGITANQVVVIERDTDGES
jgi:hypothetical protein